MNRKYINFIIMVVTIFFSILMIYSFVSFISDHSLIEQLSKTEVVSRYNQMLSDAYKPINDLRSEMDNLMLTNKSMNYETVDKIIASFEYGMLEVDDVFIISNGEILVYDRDNPTGELKKNSGSHRTGLIGLSGSDSYRTLHELEVNMTSYEVDGDLNATIFLDYSDNEETVSVGFNVSYDNLAKYMSKFVSSGEAFAIYNQSREVVFKANYDTVNTYDELLPHEVKLLVNESKYCYSEIISTGYRYVFKVDEYIVKSKYILFLLLINLVLSMMISFVILGTMTSTRDHEMYLKKASDALDNLLLGDLKYDFEFPITESHETMRLFNGIEDIRFKMVTMDMVNKTSQKLIDLHDLIDESNTYEDFYNDVHERLAETFNIDFAVQIMDSAVITSMSSVFKYVKIQEYYTKVDELIAVNTFPQWKELSINNVHNLKKVFSERSHMDLSSIKSIQVLPIYVDKKHYGVYIIGSFTSGVRFTKVESRFFRSLLNTIGLKFSWNLQHNRIISENNSLKKANERLRLQVQRIQSESITDPVTGLYKKHHIVEALNDTLNRFESNQGVALGVIDVDNFNMIIDKYGHYASENLLKKIGTIVANQLSSYDYAGRYASDVIVVVMYQNQMDEIISAFERIRMIVSSSSFDNISQPVTVSIGMTLLRVEDSRHAAIRRAEELLDDAKHLGKNKICHDFVS